MTSYPKTQKVKNLYKKSIHIYEKYTKERPKVAVNKFI